MVELIEAITGEGGRQAGSHERVKAMAKAFYARGAPPVGPAAGGGFRGRIILLTGLGNCVNYNFVYRHGKRERAHGSQNQQGSFYRYQIMQGESILMLPSTFLIPMLVQREIKEPDWDFTCVALSLEINSMERLHTKP